MYFDLDYVPKIPVSPVVTSFVNKFSKQFNLYLFQLHVAPIALVITCKYKLLTNVCDTRRVFSMFHFRPSKLSVENLGPMFVYIQFLGSQFNLNYRCFYLSFSTTFVVSRFVRGPLFAVLNLFRLCFAFTKFQDNLCVCNGCYVSSLIWVVLCHSSSFPLIN